MATNYQLYNRFIYPTLKRILLADVKDSRPQWRVAEILVGMNALMGMEVREQDLPGVWSECLHLRQVRSRRPPPQEMIYGGIERAKTASLTKKEATQALKSFLKIADTVIRDAVQKSSRGQKLR